MSAESVTRGSGLLEAWLARRRAATAERLIPEAARQGSILDIGCGTYPYFLTRTRFAEKVGLDRHAGDVPPPPVGPGDAPPPTLHSFDLEMEDRLPMADASFDVVTMLAVFEHIATERLPALLTEVHRVLRGGGRLVLTTPAGWTGPILWALAKVGLVSSEEIDEHEDAYSRSAIRGVFRETPFGADELDFGSFELGMNTWVVARKQEVRASIP
jgi:SAM-dependent methyltransferase